MQQHTAEGVAAIVLGSNRLAIDLTEAVLEANGVPVIDISGPARPQVIALVEPDAEAWRTAASLNAPIVVVTEQELRGDELAEAVKRGARGTVHPDSSVATLLRTLSLVATGDTALTRAQTASLVDALQQTTPDTLALTQRELDILRSIDRGESVKQTGRALGISPKTVENLQSRLFRKLGVRNRAQAVARAHSLGLLRQDEHEATG
jgi:DNA-binding NarL/FixJ family response regulator